MISYLHHFATGRNWDTINGTLTKTNQDGYGVGIRIAPNPRLLDVDT